MIRIGVDGRVLQGNLTGVGKYVLNLLSYITEHSSDTTIIVFSNREIDDSSKAFQIIYDKPAFGKIKPMIWSKFFSYRLINKSNIDIFLSGDGFLPLFIDVRKIISIVHDVNHILVPETMSTLHLVAAKLFFKKDVSKASYIITNSYGTAQKVEKYFNKKTDIVVYPIIDKYFKVLDKEDVRQKLVNLKITSPYILAVATQEPRKNLTKTIGAFTSLKKEGEIPLHKLLLVGSKGWKSEEIKQLINDNEEIVSMGYIDDDTMPYLYNGADVFVFPSKYEGFGMPPREALLCGTGAIVTDIPELREATCGLAKYIDPEDDYLFQVAILEEIKDKGSVFFKENAECKDQLEKLIPLINKSVCN